MLSCSLIFSRFHYITQLELTSCHKIQMKLLMLARGVVKITVTINVGSCALVSQTLFLTSWNEFMTKEMLDNLSSLWISLVKGHRKKLGTSTALHCAVFYARFINYRKPLQKAVANVFSFFVQLIYGNLHAICFDCNFASVFEISLPLAILNFRFFNHFVYSFNMEISFVRKLALCWSQIIHCFSLFSLREMI